MTENTENGDATKPTGPIEVWIRQKKATGFTCVVVYADKFTHEFDLVSQTLAAAQQEVTRRLMPVGYQPAGRWKAAPRPKARRKKSSRGCATGGRTRSMCGACSASARPARCPAP